MESSEDKNTIPDELKPQPLQPHQDSVPLHSDPILDHPSPLYHDLDRNMADEEIQNPRVGVGHALPHDKSPQTGEIPREIQHEKENPYQQIVVDAFKNLNLEERDSNCEENNTVFLDEDEDEDVDAFKNLNLEERDSNCEENNTVFLDEDEDEDVNQKDVKDVKLCSDVYDGDRHGNESDSGIEGSGHRDSDINLMVQPDGNDNPEEIVREEVVSLLGSTSGKYRRPTFPVRLDAEDCAFYIRNGTCKFGSSCKFNHPPWRKNQAANEKRKEASTDRPGQTECKYHMKAGGCKYGNTCRYNHSGGGRAPNAPILQFNFLGLPIRLEEKDCHYYMRNGTCKYGSNCMFNHPDPSSQGSEPHSGYSTNGFLPMQGVSQPAVSSWSPARQLNENGPMPIMFSPTQLSTSAQWSGYQAGSVYATGERTLSSQPAFAMNNSPMAETTNSLVYSSKQQQIVPDEYPERPGLPECSYFMKTGQCKYRSSCKFNHPKINQTIPNLTSSGVLSEKGLPQRPEKPICSHYGRYGICKYGPACKYDHPVNCTPSASITGPGIPSTTGGSGSGVGDGIPRVL